MDFCKSLQAAVKAGEKTKISGWVDSYPIEVVYVPIVLPTGHRGDPQSLLIADDEEFVEKFATIFNADVTRRLFSNTARELAAEPNGSARIANGAIEIDQLNDGAKTVILSIAAPPNYERFYADQGTYEAGTRNFLIELQHALAEDDRQKVTRLCRYPLQINSQKSRTFISNRKELLEKYPQIFTSGVKQAIADLKAPILVGSRGFMTEHGEIWFDQVVGTEVLRIGTINIPLAAADPAQHQRRGSGLDYH